MNNNLIIKKFETPIGEVECKLETSTDNCELIATNNYENGTSETFKIGGYKIELVEFKIRQPLYNGETILDSQGWIWRIDKIEDSNIKLNLSCQLINYPNDIEFDTAHGEHLCAIEAYNENWNLHIGTEDGEIMNERAERNDRFPTRLQELVNFYESISQTKKNSIETIVPNLEVNESLHIHYLTAYDKPKIDSANTWFAVDEFKRKLENWIGIF